MPVVPFYDINTDSIIEVALSDEDALRAETDIVFATNVMQASLKQQAATQEYAETQEFIDLQLQEEETVQEETVTETDDSSSLYRWTEACVLLLLDNYKLAEHKFSDGKQSHKKIWEEIAKIIITKGHNVSGSQCAAKLRSLKKTYKTIKDHNAKSGNSRRTWQFFEIMDDIFSKKAWCNPVAIASSSGISIKRKETPSANETDSSYDEASSSKKKSTVTALLAKRLKQKEEHEETKNKRHKERIEMDNKFLNLLEKLVEKK